MRYQLNYTLDVNRTPHLGTSQFTLGTLQQWRGQGCKKCYSLFSREAVQFSYSLLCDFMYKMTKFPFKFQNFLPNTNTPTQWHSHRGSRGAECPLDSKNCAKSWEKEGENQEKAGKEERNQEKRKHREGSFTLPLLTDRAGFATVPTNIISAMGVVRLVYTTFPASLCDGV